MLPGVGVIPAWLPPVQTINVVPGNSRRDYRNFRMPILRQIGPRQHYDNFVAETRAGARQKFHLILHDEDDQLIIIRYNFRRSRIGFQFVEAKHALMPAVN